MSRCVVFALDDKLYAVHLSAVARVVHAVQITFLPSAPSIVIGVIDLGGKIVPVVNLRLRFHLPERELELTDQFIVARLDSGRLLALVVDAVAGVRDLSAEDTTPAQRILPGLGYLEGVARTDQGMLLIHDLATFLSLEEGRILDAILPVGNT
jgi:purine-binding chemotaxis protein CheW